MRTPRHRIQFRINGQQTTDNRAETHLLSVCLFSEAELRGCGITELRNYGEFTLYNLLPFVSSANACKLAAL